VRSALPLALALPLVASPTGEQDPCERSAVETLKSCRNEAQSDFWLARAKCSNLPTKGERTDCVLDALEEMEDAFEECREQRDARLDVCDALGGGIYHPLIDPKDFVEVIDNPYLPLLPGTHFIYEKEIDEGTERVDLFVTDQTKEILGVECVAVHDIESLDDEVVEDTIDWFAQDAHGNVWYFGEISISFEDGEIESLDGSWQAGRDGAKPGIIMRADPEEGDFYRQEFLIGEAEDVAEVLSLSAMVKVHYGAFERCLQTEESSPLEPGGFEHKFYAAGVGLVLELDPESGERLELIDVVLED